MPASRRPAKRWFRLPSPANARIRSKLGLILVVPIAAILTLAGLRLFDATGRATDADRVGQLTSLSANVSQLAHQIHRERMQAAARLTAPNATPQAVASATEAFNKQVAATDAAIGDYTTKRGQLTSVPSDVRGRLQRIDDQLATVKTIRREITERTGVTADQVLLRYGVIVEDLLSYRELLSQVTNDTRLADSLRAVAAFSKAKARLGDEQALAYGAIRTGELDAEALTSLLATLTAQQEAFVSFSLTASVEQTEIVSKTITGDAVQLAGDITAQLRRAGGQLSSARVLDALSALSAVNELMRWAEQQLDAGVIADAAAVSASVQRQTLIESIIVVAVLAIVIALALVMARSMIGSLRRLRRAALGVAEHELPQTVARLQNAQNVGRDTPDQLARQVRDPIELNTRDEIGEVAAAFNTVHREAVRVAAEQAVLRTSVSAMFLGLARRSQTLVDRMIGQLDRIERSEEDPKRLAELFLLDHLATRMRRNDENVLVLADSDSTPPRRDDAPLVDVMRAAQSEIEMYQRVEFGTVDEDVMIASHAVNDSVRLLAELLDNATRFSPPTGSVVVDGRRLGDRVLIQIEDYGLGMAPEMVAEHNARLAAPPALDVTTFRMMGLAVVGRLAHRHGITIQLRDRSGGGTLVEILVPASALVLPKVRPFRQLAAAPPPALQRPAAAFAPPISAVPMQAAPAQPAPVATVTLDDRRVGAGRTAAPAGPPQWPMTVPASPAESMRGRWADLLTEPYIPPGPGTNGWSSHDDTTELPIFREIEAVWFNTKANAPVPTANAAGGPPPTSTPMTSAPMTSAPMTGSPMTGPPMNSAPMTSAPMTSAPMTSAPMTSAPPPPHEPPSRPRSAPPPYAPAAAYGPPSAPPPPGAPPQPGAGDTRWRTRADDGWRAAQAAAEPPIAGTTRSGLPKRAPNAQLVPGGVQPQQAAQTRRSPDEVRGLLSSYHRGVRRGRAQTGADSANNGGSPNSNKGAN